MLPRLRVELVVDREQVVQLGTHDDGRGQVFGDHGPAGFRDVELPDVGGVHHQEGEHLIAVGDLGDVAAGELVQGTGVEHDAFRDLGGDAEGAQERAVQIGLHDVDGCVTDRRGVHRGAEASHGADQVEHVRDPRLTERRAGRVGDLVGVGPGRGKVVGRCRELSGLGGLRGLDGRLAAQPRVLHGPVRQNDEQDEEDGDDTTEHKVILGLDGRHD